MIRILFGEYICVTVPLICAIVALVIGDVPLATFCMCCAIISLLIDIRAKVEKRSERNDGRGTDV